MSARGTAVFIKDERGTVLVEALMVFPVLMFLSFGLLEFSNVLWERQQMQMGLRDAARYWSRCRSDINGAEMFCSETVARNIAFYGNPAGSGRLRVPGWDAADEISFDPAKASLPTNASLPGDPSLMPRVTVSGTVTYFGSPMFSALLDDSITISHTVEMRYIGW
ncbi:TadE/TadG family type IV pilus assembly protein [Alloyangia pacifica]|uniref:TadE/TadG family type IV pilus assembly protein n=1 Tax=Alloyangia pacifica TaxID=311180 RepID=UPI001CD39166|nr:TadE/TadG family type IV pilus assembly protein [Alloyangia pacifica]MCA0997990.1 pilus assembly protein [Alloyangia pacifica]